MHAQVWERPVSLGEGAHTVKCSRSCLTSCQAAQPSVCKAVAHTAPEETSRNSGLPFIPSPARLESGSSRPSRKMISFLRFSVTRVSAESGLTPRGSALIRPLHSQEGNENLRPRQTEKYSKQSAKIAERNGIVLQESHQRKRGNFSVKHLC